DTAGDVQCSRLPCLALSDEMNAAALFTEELNQRCSKRYAYRKDQPRIANALLPDLGKPVPHAPGEFVRRVEAKLGLEQQAFGSWVAERLIGQHEDGVAFSVMPANTR